MARALWSDEEGQTLIEYGLLTALIGVVVIAILVVLGRRSRDLYITITDTLVTAAE